MRHILLALLFLASAAHGAERQVPFRCEPDARLSWGKVRFAEQQTIDNNTVYVDLINEETRGDCFFSTAEPAVEGDPFADPVLHDDAPEFSEFASWNNRFESGGQLHVRQWLTAPSLGIHTAYTENRVSLDVVAGRQYQLDPVTRPASGPGLNTFNNSMYVALFCYRHGPIESWYTYGPPDRWPPVYNATHTETCSVTVGQYCRVSGLPGTKQLCHNDLVARELTPASNPSSCGIGPELALILLGLLYDRSRTR